MAAGASLVVVWVLLTLTVALFRGFSTDDMFASAFVMMPVTFFIACLGGVWVVLGAGVHQLRTTKPPMWVAILIGVSGGILTVLLLVSAFFDADDYTRAAYIPSFQERVFAESGMLLTAGFFGAILGWLFNAIFRLIAAKYGQFSVENE